MRTLSKLLGGSTLLFMSAVGYSAQCVVDNEEVFINGVKQGTATNVIISNNPNNCQAQASQYFSCGAPGITCSFPNGGYTDSSGSRHINWALVYYQ
ncbi:hypothetical protein [Fluoribacter gormanii]|uniref:hypothetical protein n=1 Tax=Fluoribacter gormanii TaxID=464 RepID=UPI00104180BB|nr:hypothetical protein [Fluoribacter gormanii]